ncbi:sigma-70 family RNA polymerase sigma factor [Ekhidna sp.]|uniref:RNA polymerase sigma factor n=1 Tax=Ekhidna sp. TaxID=2608089 RepID=UPI0032980734
MSEDFFKSYVEENMPLIMHICRAYSRDEESLKDLVQEVTLQLWRSHKSFKGNSQLSTWVYRVTLNVCLSHSKRMKRKVETIPLEWKEDSAIEEDVDKEQIEKLYTGIKKLKESDRAIILLYLEDKSYKEMSEILGITVSNVGVKVNRLKDKLKEIING